MTAIGGSAARDCRLRLKLASCGQQCRNTASTISSRELEGQPASLAGATAIASPIREFAANVRRFRTGADVSQDRPLQEAGVASPEVSKSWSAIQPLSLRKSAEETPFLAQKVETVSAMPSALTKFGKLLAACVVV